MTSRHDYFFHSSDISQEIKDNKVLLELKEYIERHGFSLNANFGLPEPQTIDIPDSICRMIKQETEHNFEFLESEIKETEILLNEEQQIIVNSVMESIDRKLGKMISIDASGGTGKTFVLCFILNKIRSQGKVALATAGSGIAATLLPKGTTFHSRTKCPLILTDESICNISENEDTASLIRITEAMIVDEVSMMDRRALEAADRTFKWLRKSDKPFGGITMVFSGDWRQILTVVPHGSKMDIIERCFKSSFLWNDIQILQLKENMRIKQTIGNDQEEQANFATFLLELGEGKIPVNKDEGEFSIELNESLKLNGETLEDMVNWVYNDLDNNIENHNWLCERVILCSTNSEVDMVNKYLTKRFPGEEYICNSVDTADCDGNYVIGLEILNNLCPSGMPPHQMSLKIGMIIMLLRNIDQQNGHCNGSRYVIQQIYPHVLVVKSIIGRNSGLQLLIPRFNLCPTDNILPFTMYRRQFPIRPCFAMTINKSQGQTLQRVGVFCIKDFFSHGQFYVAASRVGKSSNFLILALDEKTKTKRKYLSNVVYKEVLTN